MSDLVNIIMPAFNSERTIQYSIKSVFEQSYRHWRLIVVDDCSSDGTARILREYENDPRITIVRNSFNRGVSASRNVALDQVKEGWIAFLDSDDYWLKDKLERQIKFAENSSDCIIHTYYAVVDERKRLRGVRKGPIEGDLELLLRRNYIGTSTAMVRLELVKSLRFIEIGHEDYAFWISILKNSQFKTKCVPEVLTFYQISSNSLSGNKLRAARWTWVVLRKVAGLSRFRALCSFFSYAISAFLIRIEEKISFKKMGDKV
ncbi:MULTISPECIES: glycosyltransferase [Pseudidiomarina]|uniref:Glycosyl transferase family 2 n=2 Tax=Pseudidiomarina TaxID=2800384 RepID=A0A368UL53_9GAMM|nr:MULTISPECIES: glycosyltransferase [Pseudidiomarina]PWW06856.1 glycosyl transferase family 2 [Pseudidiomarina maritima]RBP86598.1 glycosyl transferase family 2 [Pseudidiomarina tainanensis]RCW28875.1 glycosyl transferase family 2 [Pseudidiomarina tainanensis]